MCIRDSGSGAEIDLSAVSQGYVAVRAQSDKRLKCQVVYGDVKYNYDLPRDGTPVVYPLQSGNGQYLSLIHIFILLLLLEAFLDNGWLGIGIYASVAIFMLSLIHI